MKIKILNIALIFLILLAFASCNRSKKSYSGSSSDTVGNNQSESWREFVLEEFENPENKYRPMPIIHTEIDGAYIYRLQEWGYGGLVTNVSFDAYMTSEEGWETFVDTTELLMKAGLRMWIYDERQYPSGAAGGQVLKKNPEYEAQALVSVVTKPNKNNKIEVGKPYGHDNPIFAVAYKGSSIEDIDVSSAKNVLPFSDNFGKISWQAPDKNWLVVSMYTKPFYEGTHATNNWAEYRRYINLLKPESVKSFINITYKEYYERVGKYFGNGIEAFFTDEPSLLGTYFTSGPPTAPVLIDEIDKNIPQIPAVNWSDNLEKVFKTKRGYSMSEYLPYLFGGDSAAAKKFRWDFYRTTSELVSENYMGQIADYLDDKGVAISGHLLLEEDIYMHPVFEGNIMQIYSKMQFPGIDLLTSSPKRAINLASTVAKFASSSADFHGRKTVMSEVSDAFDDVKGDVYGRIGSIAVQYAMGVNQITSFYPPTGMSKEENRLFTDTIGRMGYMMSDGRHDANVLLYYPIEGIWVDTYAPENLGSFAAKAVKTSNEYSELCRDLIGNQIDYSIIDSVDLKSCSVKDGKIVTPLGQKFSVFVLPKTSALEKETFEFLVDAAKSGVKVVVQKSEKTIVYGEIKSDKIKELLSYDNVITATNVKNVIKKTEKLSVKTISIDGADKYVVATKRKHSNGKSVYMIVNASEKVNEFTAVLDEAGTTIKTWDPYSGEVETLSDLAGKPDLSKVKIKVELNRTMFITVEA